MYSTFFFLFKQKTAYEMRISDWSSDVCSSDLTILAADAKLIVALLGANDGGAAGTVGTFGAIPGEPVVSETDIDADYAGTKFIQAVSHIIRKLVADYDNVRERADLSGSETASTKKATYDAVLKETATMATQMPDAEETQDGTRNGGEVKTRGGHER